MRRSAVSLVLLFASAMPAAAQTQPAAPSPPTGAFVGHLRSESSGGPIHLADIRLYFIDSTTEVRGLLGMTTLETFVDTVRSRVAATDSTGFFAVWRLAPGRYWMYARRIGFSPIEAFVTIDSQTVLHDFTMPAIPMLLNKVEIKEVSETRVAKRLDHVGFMSRKKFHAEGGTFIVGADVQRYKPVTARDILSRYGIFDRNVDIIMDWMALDYSDILDYPAELVAAVEIYRHGRPSEFNGTRVGPSVLGGGNTFLRRPLVILWTHVP